MTLKLIYVLVYNGFMETWEVKNKDYGGLNERFRKFKKFTRRGYL